LADEIYERFRNIDRSLHACDQFQGTFIFFSCQQFQGKALHVVQLLTYMESNHKEFIVTTRRKQFQFFPPGFTLGEVK